MTTMREAIRDVPDGHGVMAVMGSSGDTRTMWDPDNEHDVDMARATFNHLRAKGYLAYKVAFRGRKGDELPEFDPKAGAMILAFDPSPSGATIMVPPMRGGADATAPDRVATSLESIETLIDAVRNDAWSHWNGENMPPEFEATLDAIRSSVAAAQAMWATRADDPESELRRLMEAYDVTRLGLYDMLAKLG